MRNTSFQFFWRILGQLMESNLKVHSYSVATGMVSRIPIDTKLEHANQMLQHLQMTYTYWPTHYFISGLPVHPVSWLPVYGCDETPEPRQLTEARVYLGYVAPERCVQHCYSEVTRHQADMVAWWQAESHTQQAEQALWEWHEPSETSKPPSTFSSKVTSTNWGPSIQTSDLVGSFRSHHHI